MFIQKLTNRSRQKNSGELGSGLKNSTAQATTELAILGTIILLIFGAFLRYAMIYNAKQEIQMYAFRQALNLTKQRYDGVGVAPAKQLASVNLNVMANTYPVNLGGSVQEPTVADGSASIYAEVEPGDFGDEDGPNDLDDVGGSYYQIGDRMIVDGVYIEPAYIKVKRKIREDKPPSTAWDSVADWIRGKDDKTDYDSWQPLPYWEQEQYTNVTHSSQYLTAEDQYEAAAGQIATTRTVTQTRFKPQPEDKIRQWDPDVLQVYEVVNYPAAQDMVVTTDQTFQKVRVWDSDK